MSDRWVRGQRNVCGSNSWHFKSVSFVAPVITDHEVRDNAATARNNSQLAIYKLKDIPVAGEGGTRVRRVCVDLIKPVNSCVNCDRVRRYSRRKMPKSPEGFLIEPGVQMCRTIWIHNRRR